MSLLLEAAEGKERAERSVHDQEIAREYFTSLFGNAMGIVNQYGIEAPRGRDEVFDFTSDGHQRIVRASLDSYNGFVDVLLLPGMNDSYIDIRVQYLPKFLRIHNDGRGIIVEHEKRNGVTHERLSPVDLIDVREYGELIRTVKSHIDGH